MMKLDRILGLVLLTLAIAYGWGAFHFPAAFAGPESVGPATFPKILAFILGACSLGLVLKPEPGAEALSLRVLCEIGFVLAVLLGYVFLIEPLGFILATTLMVALLCWRMGVRPLAALLTGLIGSSGVFLLFHFGLALPLPIGPWEM